MPNYSSTFLLGAMSSTMSHFAPKTMLGLCLELKQFQSNLLVEIELQTTFQVKRYKPIRFIFQLNKNWPCEPFKENKSGESSFSALNGIVCIRRVPQSSNAINENI